LGDCFLADSIICRDYSDFCTIVLTVILIQIIWPDWRHVDASVAIQAQRAPRKAGRNDHHIQRGSCRYATLTTCPCFRIYWTYRTTWTTWKSWWCWSSRSRRCHWASRRQWTTRYSWSPRRPRTYWCYRHCRSNWIQGYCLS